MSLRSFLATLLLFSTVVRAEEKRGDQPDAPALSPKEQLGKFKVPTGFEVQFVASEPQIQKPINLNVDAAGRLWATGSELYPWPAATDVNGQPIAGFEKGWKEMASAFGVGDKAPQPSPVGRDTVRILSDFAPDGRARKIETFADGLNIPTGIQPLPRKPGSKGDTAIVFSIPNIWRFEDTDGDGKADKREPLYTGFGYTDTHGMSSSYIYWIDGWIYGTHGFRNHSEVRDRQGRVTVFDSGNTYRFRPDGSQIEYWSHGQTNPFGLAFDPLGNLYSADSHSKPVYLLLRGGYYEGIGKQHDGLGFAPRITEDDHGSSSIAGIAYYADDKWPEEFRGNLFNGNPVTRRINRARLEWHGSTPKAIRMDDFLTCDDPWFRPVQVKLGPDGALYIADFYNPIIGHYEVPLTHPARDHNHGRIWRVVWRGEKKDAIVAQTPDLATLNVEGLVEKLGHGNLEVRRLATNELVDRVAKHAVPALKVPLSSTRTITKRLVGLAGKTIELQLPTWTSSPNERIGALYSLNRLGALDDSVLRTAFEGEKPVAIHTLKIVGDTPVREALTNLTDLAAQLPDALMQRAASEAIAALSQSAAVNPFGASAIAELPRNIDSLSQPDPQLLYATLVALREQLQIPGVFREASVYASEFPERARILADVSLAVPTAEAAEFLLAHLQRIRLAAPRAGEFLKHVALHLSIERLDALTRIVDEIKEAPLPQRLNVADNLTQAIRQRSIRLPDEVTAWTQRVMIEALANSDKAIVDRAIAAVRDAKLEEKIAPLQKIVADVSGHGPRRAAALEALMNVPRGREVAAQALADPSSMTLRKKAAELLGQSGDDTSHTALLNALPLAPWELALPIATSLAKSDTSCEALVAMIESGKASPALLRNKAVAGPLAARPVALKERAAKLTADLPPEDARLDTVIAQRVTDYRAAQVDQSHGAQVFQQGCAVCHKVRNTGGNIGPNLDGMGARGVHRLIEDILDPNRNVDPAFAQIIIETDDGQTLAGVNLRTEGELLVLSDVQGKPVSVRAAQVKSKTASKLSLMPPIFEQTLSAQDLSDLVAFLLAQTDSKP